MYDVDLLLKHDIKLKFKHLFLYHVEHIGKGMRYWAQLNEGIFIDHHF